MKFLLTVLLLVSCFSSEAQQKELAALLKKENVPGIQLIHTKSKTVTMYSLGLRQSGRPATVDARTTFQAASLGKVVLAYLTLRLHDQGLLDLDKPLLTYYAYPRLAKEPKADKITARLVLTHATKACSPRRTVSGPPTTEQASALSSMARAWGGSRASKSSTGGGSLPGRPLRRFRKDCRRDENRRRASASVSAAKTFTPSITCGAANRAEGRNRAR